MTRPRAVALPVALLVALTLSGCASDNGGDPTSTSTSASAQAGTVTSVRIEAPAAPSGGKSEVCWNVQGTGTVAHVAIHWDTESHASQANRTFAHYDAGAAYPGNTAALDAKGYTLPGRFCASVDVPASGSIYIVGHAIGSAGAPGELSAEAVLASAVPAVGVAQAPTFTSVPATAAPGSKVTICWSVAGTGNVPHVAIHWDNVTHAADAGRSFALYDAGASYPGNQSAPATGGYNLQVTGTRFCTAATMPASGSIFVVAHVIDSTGAPGKLSEEREVQSPAATGTTTSGSPSTGPLVIRAFAYVPATYSVARGATVTVTNEDAVPHTVTGATFSSGDIPAGATRTFAAPATAGDHTFTCAYHSGMQGTLRVL